MSEAASTFVPEEKVAIIHPRGYRDAPSIGVVERVLKKHVVVRDEHGREGKWTTCGQWTVGANPNPSSKLEPLTQAHLDRRLAQSARTKLALARWDELPDSLVIELAARVPERRRST